MTTPTDPGWYDDPDVANAQRYWDGQGWTPQRQRKPVAQPASTPAPQGGPPPPQVGSPVGGPPRRKLWPVVAGVGGLILVIMVLAGLSHDPAPSANQSTGAGGNQPAAPHPGKNKPSWAGSHYQEGRSQAYQDGYEWGDQHMGPGQIAFDCYGTRGQRDVPNRSRSDWLEGCADGLADVNADPGAAGVKIPPNIPIPGWMECLGGDESKC